MRPLRLALVLTGLALPSSPDAVVLDQVDDFEDGTTRGWSEGAQTPNPPVNVPDGGPQGAGDNYLENVSSGVAGPGGRMVMFNSDQWAGDYVTAGIDHIGVWLRNGGESPLPVRLAFEGAATQFTTTFVFTVPPDGQWYETEFPLDDLTLIGGTATPEAVLSSVAAVRILAAAGPTWIGDAVAGVLGVDELTAFRGVIPTRPATWGSLKTRFPEESR